MRLQEATLPLRGRSTQARWANYAQAQYPAPSLRHAHILCESQPATLLHPKTNIPSDVLRRRFQINTMTGMGYQYKSIGDAVITIVGQEGVRGMYKGLVPNLLKVAPSMAASWASFEFTRDTVLAFGQLAGDE